MTDNSQSIDTLVASYSKLRKAIVVRRKDWNERLKPLVEKVFGEVTERHSVGWQLTTNYTQKNFESIFLAFPPSPSGIILEDSDGMRHCAVHAGYLALSLVANGKVNVWARLPYVEHVEKPVPDRELDTLEPSEINESELWKYVERFLALLIEAETESRHQIGFGAVIGAVGAES